MMTQKHLPQNNTTVIGIDYSMNSPALCMHRGQEWSFENCKWYYLTTKKKYSLQTDQFYSQLLEKEFESNEQRFHFLSEFFIRRIKHFPPGTPVFLERYSFASKGSRLFDIGELTGVLKHKVFLSELNITLVSPGTVKKTATGSGKAEKQQMIDAFISETSFDIRAHIGDTENPVSDIVDSYYIAKYGFMTLQKVIKAL